jgi:hypothetical protein
MTRKPGRDPSVQPSRSRYGASYPHPILKYWCALNTTSPGQSRGRAGASLLTASPTVPACRPAYVAATCHWATRDRHTGARLLLCNIAHAHPYPQGFVGLERRLRMGCDSSCRRPTCCRCRPPGLTFIEVMPLGDVGEGRLDQYLPLSMVRPRSKRIRNRRNLIFA